MIRAVSGPHNSVPERAGFEGDTELSSPRPTEGDSPGGGAAQLRADRGAVRALAFSPDGRPLACGDRGGLCKLWHAAAGQEVYAFRAHPRGLAALGSTADGGALVTGGEREVTGELRVWPAPRGAAVAEAVQPPTGPAAARRTAGDTAREITLWDVSKRIGRR